MSIYYRLLIYKMKTLNKIRWTIPMDKDYINKYNIITLVPGWIWPLEMLYLVSKIKNISNEEMNTLINENIVFTEFKI